MLHQRRKGVPWLDSYPWRPSDAYILGKPSEKAFGKMRLSLHTNFNGLEWAKSDISNYFSWCTAGEKYQTLVLIHQYVWVYFLKVFIQTKSTSTLRTIAKKLPSPSSPKCRGTLFPQQSHKASGNATILDRVHLQVKNSTS